MKNFIGLFCLLLSTLTISCGRCDPSGVYYGGPDLTPSVYYYTFEDNGNVLVCQGKSYTRNCCTEGQWTTDSKGNITISGLNSTNCYFMNGLNGTYKVCDEPKCIPSGRGYKKGDIYMWPDDK